MQIHEAESLNYDVALAKWKSDKKTDPDTTPPEKPVEPVAVRTHTADPTIEALGQLLRENPRGLLLARDELSGWIASFDAYKHASGADIANWLQLHRGREMLTDRKTGNRITYVPMAACSVCGTIQPQTFRNFIANEDNLANGFCARVLLAEPPPRRKRWTEADVPVGVEDRLHEVFERLYELDHYERADGERDPIDVVLSDAAKRAWIEFFTVLADVQFNLDDENLAAAFSKLEGYAARFALIVHLVRWASGDAANPNAIDAGDIEAGAALSRWFCHEARRIYGTFAESAEQRERRQNLERVGKAGGFVTVRGWHRLKHHKSASDAEAELQCLVDAGFGLWEHDAPSDRGGRPGKRFVLCDSVTRDKTPTHDRATGGIVTCHTVTRGSTKLEADPLDRASGGDDEPPPDALANKIDSGAFDADEAGGSEGPNGPPTGAALDSGDRTANFGGCER